MTLHEVEKRLGLPHSVLERFVSLGIIRKCGMSDEYQEKDFERLGLADILLNAGFSAEDIQKYFQLEESGDADEQQIGMLRKRRRLLLDDIHKNQRLLDSLDYMILEKRNMAKSQKKVGML